MQASVASYPCSNYVVDNFSLGIYEANLKQAVDYVEVLNSFLPSLAAQASPCRLRHSGTLLSCSSQHRRSLACRLMSNRTHDM